MEFKHTHTFNFQGALRGMRNPMNSWDKSDSLFTPSGVWCIGDKDLKLAQRLVLAGSEHGKFMRQIFVSADITAPIYWWKEMDTYKVGTVVNSTSTMHKLITTPITLDCFETDDYVDWLEVDKEDIKEYDPDLFYDHWHIEMFTVYLIEHLEQLRLMYLKTKDRRYWKELIRWLPESWLQTRTWTANYAILRNIYFQRQNHKLIEWHKFCEWIETLPYAAELITLKEKPNEIN